MIGVIEALEERSELVSRLTSSGLPWAILGEKHEGVQRYYMLQSDSNEMQFELGVAVAFRDVMPKALRANSGETVVAYDYHISSSKLSSSGDAVITVEQKIYAYIIDLFHLRDGNLCLVYELGAIIFDGSLSEKETISTDVISFWKFDPLSQTLYLTELDSGTTSKHQF